MTTISNDQIINAYRKLKHYFFMDTSALKVRYRIAEWELDIDSNIRAFQLLMNEYLTTGNNELFRPYFDQLGWVSFPKNAKSVAPSVYTKNQNCNISGLHKNTCSNESHITKVFNFIDAPIELHLVSVLWAMLAGQKIEDHCPVKEHWYGNVLKRNSKQEAKEDTLGLFEPFFLKYNQWRERAIATALTALEEKSDVVLLSMDINQFYDSVVIGPNDLLALKFDHCPLYSMLTALLFDIHVEYFKKRDLYIQKANIISETGLPIGLLSSGILANWYMRNFDQEILKRRPLYYGRYVDDILLVFQNTRSAENVSQSTTDYIKSYLGSLLADDTDGNIGVFSDGKAIAKNLKLNTSKSLVFQFDHRHPKTLLKQLADDIRRNSSGFKFLPDEDEVSREFDDETHQINYNDTGSGKIRDIQGLVSGKFKLTRYLAQHIFYTRNLGHKVPESSGKQIASYFVGTRAIENYAQWERVIAYLFLNCFWKELSVFLNEINLAIGQVKGYHLEPRYESDNLTRKLKECLEEHLQHCVYLSVSLEPSRKTDSVFAKFHNLDNAVACLRNSGMLRHKYMAYPILGITTLCSKTELSLINKSTYLHAEKEGLKQDALLIKYCPRFLGIHEIALLQFWCMIREITEYSESINVQHLESVFENYREWNRLPDRKGDAFKFSENNLEHNKICKIRTIDIESANMSHSGTLGIALANLALDDKTIQNSLCFHKVQEHKRDCFDDIFNQVTRYNSNYFEASGLRNKKEIDLLVLPELALPHTFLYGICKQARKSGVGVISGLSHITIANNKVLNVVAVVLPIEVEGHREVLPILRIKNYYSPAEKELIESHSAKNGAMLKAVEPSYNNKSYDWIHWRNAWFSIYNCFELTDIEHRSIFKSKVDFVVACEFNSDVNYFSNIVESAARDLHCYFIQSNNARYGDSRICAPWKYEQRDLLKVKGGLNPTILVDEIDIEGLRYFQSTDYAAQKKSEKFKPTPAGFDRSKSNQRFPTGNKTCPSS